MTSEDKGFAARWSSRKEAVRQTELANLEQKNELIETEDGVEGETETGTGSESGSDPSNIEGEETAEEVMLTEEDFDDVDFEALDKSSDYTRFIKSNVPAVVQKKALRQLWASDSVFEVLDGMNDYDEDFTGNGLAGKAFKSAYKVGRGFLESKDLVAESDLEIGADEDEITDIASSAANSVDSSADGDETPEGDDGVVASDVEAIEDQAPNEEEVQVAVVMDNEEVELVEDEDLDISDGEV